jgi:hypothetical protein
MLAGVKITVYFKSAGNSREVFDLGDKAREKWLGPDG